MVDTGGMIATLPQPSATAAPAPGPAAGQRGSYWITTFGCQMNKADSERMAGILESMGYSEAPAELEADLVLYNTCTIRDNAEQKVYSYLGRQAQRKRSNPHLTLVVAGCVAQQEGEALLRRVPELDLVMAPQHANPSQALAAPLARATTCSKQATASGALPWRPCITARFSRISMSLGCARSRCSRNRSAPARSPNWKMSYTSCRPSTRSIAACCCA